MVKIDISALNELETLDLLKELSEHMRREKMEHLIDQVYDMYDFKEEISDLEDEVSDLEKKIDELEGDNLHLSGDMGDALKVAQGMNPDSGHDVLQEQINQIIEHLTQ